MGPFVFAKKITPVIGYSDYIPKKNLRHTIMKKGKVISMMNKVIGYVIAGGIGAVLALIGSTVVALVAPEKVRDSAEEICKAKAQEEVIAQTEVSAE